MKKLKRLVQIKTKTEVFLITYALGLGAVERGMIYLQQYPGKIGWVFFCLCTGSVFLASSKMLQAVEYHQLLGVD
ncbi:MAG: hypothetical protein HC843_12920 [Sphingomonadales bacterium]|nr:hypothetical protein [Sphingomonadales bacterium]